MVNANPALVGAGEPASAPLCFYILVNSRVPTQKRSIRVHEHSDSS